MTVVAPVATPQSETELAMVLAAAHVAAFGLDPLATTLGCCWAQCALEHARGRAVYGNNFGNLTAGPTWAGDLYERHTLEQVQPDIWHDVTMHFRAYPTAAEGARAYWVMLQDHYGDAVVLFDLGEPERAAEYLSKKRYYTAPLAQYSTAMRSLYSEFVRKLLPALPAGTVATL